MSSEESQQAAPNPLSLPWSVAVTHGEPYDAWPGGRKEHGDKCPVFVGARYRIVDCKARHMNAIHSYADFTDMGLHGGDLKKAHAFLDENEPKDVAEMRELCRLLNSWGYPAGP